MEKDKNQLSKKADNKKIDLDKYYKSPDSPSVRTLNFGLWLASNRRSFIRGFIMFLILVCLGFFLYSGYHYFMYFFGNQAENDKLLGSSASNQVVSQKNLYSDLILGVPQVFSNKNSYDLALKIKNPNDKFVARFDYCFTQAGQDISCTPSFVFPQEEKYLLSLGQELKSSDQVSFSLRNLSWSRLNAHTYPDWPQFYKSHTNFLVSELKFNQQEAIPGFNNLEFVLTNQTPYNFWSVPFNILIFNGSNLVGVNSYTAKDFLSQASLSVKLSWSGRLNSAQSVSVVPNLDIVSPDIYLKR